jgi:predicted transcriptional regulator
MKKKSKITAEDIESSLSRFCEELGKSLVPLDKVPAGWFTVAQLAQKIGKSYCTTSERVRRMVNTGKAERKNYTVQLDQRIRPVPHYRLKK